ncbi:hypothetical protein AX16_010823 [Volvariella volvacea WC 439]|nr:hypothetical protein AX16_010823 [Volvariella volvacea WC 439]
MYGGFARFGYQPTNDDILNIQIPTFGVREYLFPVARHITSTNWRFYDAGGVVSFRQAWEDYLQDATAIIFLVPISTFDEYLEENPQTNRLQDSMQLFTDICATLLWDVPLVLVLTKAVSTQRAKAKNRDIKVLLLGQAGSGKSTLIKQLQLRYAPEAIERDRPSWRAVVYFTIIKAVRGILDRLWFLLTKNPERGPRIHPYLTLHEVQDDISVMRMRLLPLFTIGDRLATELRGGASPRVELDEIAGVAAQALASLVEDINALWRHGTVRGLVKRRKLKLDESAH